MCRSAWSTQRFAEAAFRRSVGWQASNLTFGSTAQEAASKRLLEYCASLSASVSSQKASSSAQAFSSGGFGAILGQPCCIAIIPRADRPQCLSQVEIAVA